MSIRAVALFAAPPVALAIAGCLHLPESPHAPAMLGVALWMAIWWIGECVPIALTALIPLIAFPLFGIAAGKAVAPHYINSIIFLFIGGFLIDQALEQSGLHKRLALTLLSRLHAGPLQLTFGFSLATALFPCGFPIPPPPC